MILRLCLLALLSPLCSMSQDSNGERRIRLPENPQISPDGSQIAFDWRGDIWIAMTKDGRARRLTLHVSKDSSPFFSPDGNRVAFMSARSGNTQVHIMSIDDGSSRQLTTVTTSKQLLGYSRDGKSLLLSISSDRSFARTESKRLYRYNIDTGVKTLLMDCGFSEAALAPDGGSVLFTRGRASWTRKGYTGSQALQLWLADLTQNPVDIKRLDSDQPHFQNISKKAPLWAPDGKSFLCVSDPDGTFDVYRSRSGSWKPQRVSNVSAIDGTDDGVSYPSLTADGKTILARRLFDLVTIDAMNGKVKSIGLTATGDRIINPIENRLGSGATSVAFTDDGRQMAFVSEGDIFVMDRILREPVRVTSTPHVETELLFSRDGESLYWVSDAISNSDIWKATHDGEKGYWWLAKTFSAQPITNDAASEQALSLSPDGKTLAYVRGTNICLMDTTSHETRPLTETWNAPRFDWSPDSKWIVYTTMDENYNSDVFIQNVDGDGPAFNLSRHPDRDGNAVWSPDGKRIAFTGRRDGEETDIYHVLLAHGDAEESSRDRKMTEAIAAMKKPIRSTKGPSGVSSGGGDTPRRSGRGAAQRRRRRPASGGSPEKAATEPKTDLKSQKITKPVAVTIDFDGIHDRMQRIRIPNSSERGLLFSPDGKRLLFSATVDGTSGVYVVEFPKLEKPKKIADRGVASARWLAKSDEIVGLSSSASSPSGPPQRGPRRRGGRSRSGGSPAAMSTRGELKTFSFTVRVVRDWASLREAAFDGAWRAMRDRFYDPNMNNRDWDTIRRKYRGVAKECLGAEEFSSLVNMMLGELNASHMGHRGGSGPVASSSSTSSWADKTQSIGLRYTMSADGALVTSVIPRSPCSQSRSMMRAGDTVTAIDGLQLSKSNDIDRILTRDSIRGIVMSVTAEDGTNREVNVTPVSSVSGLLYDEWVSENRRTVDSLSEGKLGYLHIRSMNMSSLRDMEEDLFDAGHGKDGLVIDVRFNGGGSTTDHVLTVLTQPEHAITVSPGSGEGYPQDRKVYASWKKPIVLMCNEHSFSNAEILAHAIKHLKRGRVVGMRTAGGVISTGSARLIDGSTVRMPTRGWFLKGDGADMELNGCEPDICLWNKPGGRDDQLREAVRALAEDVKTAAETPRVKPTRAAELRK